MKNAGQQHKNNAKADKDGPTQQERDRGASQQTEVKPVNEVRDRRTVEATLATPWRLAIGTNMPLMKINGNRTRLDSIMTLEGFVLAGDARSTPRVEKQNAPSSRLIAIRRTPKRLTA